MALLNFLKPKNKLEEGGRGFAPVQQDDGEPQKKCPNCHKEIPLSYLWGNRMVCSCGYHFRMKTRQRIRMIAEKDSFCELYGDVKAGNPLDFPGYSEKLDTVRSAGGEAEAVICGTARIGSKSCCLFVMEADIILAEPGATVGFAGARVVEQTTKKSLPEGFQKAEFVLQHGFLDSIVSRAEQSRKAIWSGC